MSFIYPATPKGRPQRQSAIRRNTAELRHYTADNVLSVIAQATPTEETAGVLWYHTAHEHAAELPNVSLKQGAGVIAALSPQTSWTENLALAYAACDTGTATGHYDDACEKADRILRGEDPFVVLRGRKVRSFYANILCPDRSGPVTVDRHAVSILAYDREEQNRRTLERAGVYAFAAGVYRSVARDLQLLPHQAQATAWLVWRRLHDVPAHREEF